jgi:hypothetical protein
LNRLTIPASSLVGAPTSDVNFGTPLESGTGACARSDVAHAYKMKAASKCFMAANVWSGHATG